LDNIEYLGQPQSFIQERTTWHTKIDNSFSHHRISYHFVLVTELPVPLPVQFSKPTTEKNK